MIEFFDDNYATYTINYDVSDTSGTADSCYPSMYRIRLYRTENVSGVLYLPYDDNFIRVKREFDKAKKQIEELKELEAADARYKLERQRRAQREIKHISVEPPSPSKRPKEIRHAPLRWLLRKHTR